VELLVIGDPRVKLDTGIGVKIDNPSEVGADRLVNAFAAWNRYKCALIVVDFGTATTFDVVNSAGDYIGGIIAPGVNLSLDALQRAAAKLPTVAIQKPAKVVGTNTVGAMQSGIYYGYAGLIEGIVSRIIAEYGKPMKVIATGGLSSLYSKASPMIEHLEPDLTIYGLKELYTMNRQK
jgi:type III pantothenate kinase